ncbi:carbohydrate porin [Methylomonas sp. AM2-LC]|uniref:carbohydrate porin n=1 Tax=Methylomonas sp. AM2-LC TaxID=3153301 RepID=UPI003264B99E
MLLSFKLNAFADERAPQKEEFPIDDVPGFSFMRTLAENGLHDLQNERWNLYGQGTFISQWHPAFPAAYTNVNGSRNSLLPQAQNAFTGTVTLYGGLKLWEGTELYGAPEMISEDPFSNLKGLGGSIQDFEFQKSGTVQPTWYRSRAYVKQTFNLGGQSTHLDSGPLQLAQDVDNHRVVVSFGDMSVLDIFDKNTFSGDLRQQFFNMSFMTYGAYDFAADSRGYTVGLAAELYYDNWTYRIGRFLPPKNPNDLSIDFRAFKYYGDQIEVEHKHTVFGQEGAVRILGFHNHEDTGSFAGAISAYQADSGKNAANCLGWNYGSNNTSAPDVCWARRTDDKYGIGINLEQHISEDIGFFFRGMYNDGRTEVYNYTSTDRSISLGTVFHGKLWGRHKDALGVGLAQNMLSAVHVKYLQMGGIDQFIGDGYLTYRPEQVLDVYYKYNLISSAFATADYQFINHPGYNADRGPMSVLGLRFHVDF